MFELLKKYNIISYFILAILGGDYSSVFFVNININIITTNEYIIHPAIMYNQGNRGEDIYDI